IDFGDQPVKREISDVNANTLTATFTSGNVNVIQPNPLPMLVALTPNSATAGGPGFTLTVTGSNFVNNSTGTSIVQWNGSPRTTSFTSSTKLNALITAQDIASAGTATVTVFNPMPGGGLSSGLTFTINSGVPTITTVTPNSATAGSGDVAITVNGTNFANTSKVRFNSTDLVTAFGSATQLTATIPASSLTTAGVANITVFNPPPGGGTSNAVNFTVNNPAPTITTLNPSSAVATGPGFTLTVNGTGFVAGSTVQWNGSNRTTTFGSATQ